MVVPGTNQLLGKEDMDRAQPLFEQAKIVGFQLETPLDVVCYGIKSAYHAGAQTLLDPAPACPLPEEIYPMLTIIKPNEVEASMITGIDVKDVKSAYLVGEWFLKRGVKHAIITLGENGAVCVDEKGYRHFAVPVVERSVCDTTGAGDCFSGVLMAMLAEDMDMDEAICAAVCASTLSATYHGVIDALPYKEQILPTENG